MKSLARIMKADIIIPDFSSISKLCINIAKHLPTKAAEPAIIFFIDSNGLKVYDKEEWHQENNAPS